MAIDTKKILNIPIEHYFTHLNPGREYSCVAIHSDNKDINEFAKLVPNKAECVVNYEHNFFGAGTDSGRYKFLHHQMGIALIPL